MQERSDKRIIAICLLLSVGIFITDSLLPLGVAGGVPYILVILISLWSYRIKLPIYMAIGVSILTVLGACISPPGGELWKAILNRFLALFAIWSVAILSVQRKTIHKKNEQALREIKTLRGFLPICASCKKIKDDHGYWKQIESYIKEHSEAEFSHGICPDCAKKLYPDIDLYPKK